MMDSDGRDSSYHRNGIVKVRPFQTLVCFLCGGTHIYPGPRFENHLLNEHGVVFEIEFIVALAKFKRKHGQLPRVEDYGDVKEDDHLLKDDSNGSLRLATNFAQPPRLELQNKPIVDASFEFRRNVVPQCAKISRIQSKARSMRPTSPPIEPKKRKIDPISERDPRQDSRAVTTSPQQGEGDTGDLTGRAKPSSNGVSKWNRCVYQCCFCGKSTQSRSSMTSHIQSSHGIPIKEYKEKEFPDIEVETHWFQCRLCPTRTKFVKDCIAPHLKIVHGLEVDDYDQRWMHPEDWPKVVSLRTDTAWVSELPDPNSSNGGTCAETEIEDSLASTEADKWNQCLFRCAICQWSNFDARQMRAHIAAKHHLSYETYVQANGPAEELTAKFQCGLCPSEMKHCRQNIYAHMKDVHKLTLDEYEAQMADNPVKQSPLKEKAPLEHGVEILGQTSRWNKCRFQCGICQKVSSERRHIRDHVARVHAMTMPDYEGTYGDCEIHTEYFSCAVCRSEVKHNLKNISLHLQNVHGLTPQDYEDRHGRVPERAWVVPVSSNADSIMAGSHFLLESSNKNNQADDLTPVMDEAGLPRSKPSRSTAHIPGGLVCKFCEKVFSSRSNCNRHMMLSCEAQKDASAKAPKDEDQPIDVNNNSQDRALDLTEQSLALLYPDCKVSRSDHPGSSESDNSGESISLRNEWLKTPPSRGSRDPSESGKEDKVDAKTPEVRTSGDERPISDSSSVSSNLGQEAKSPTKVGNDVDGGNHPSSTGHEDCKISVKIENDSFRSDLGDAIPGSAHDGGEESEELDSSSEESSSTSDTDESEAEANSSSSSSQVHS